MKNGERIVLDDRAYQLDAVLSSGAGSYGQVWAATDQDGRAVALKFINTEVMAQADPSLRGHWRAHLEREIAFLAGLDAEQSRHIVTLIDHGQVDGQPVLVLERLAANLGQWLAQQRRDNAPPPDLEQILDWAEQILSGLEVIHHAGFVYRDLKFSNILVDQRGQRLKLADFGSLKRENGDSTRSFIGTPATMAPEQALPVRFSPEGSEYRVDYRADYYALGLLLFSLCTRQPATAAQRRLGQILAQHGQVGAAQHSEQLGGLNDEEQALLRQSIEFWTVPAVTAPGGTAAALTRLVEGLLARDPAERPQNGAEIRAVLRAARAESGEPLTLAPLSKAPALVDDWDLPLPPTLPPNRYRRQGGTPSRAPWRRRALAIAGIIGVTGALAWAMVIQPKLEDAAPLAPDAVINVAPAPIDPVAPSAAQTELEAAPVVAVEEAPPEAAPVAQSAAEAETAPVAAVEEAPPEAVPVAQSAAEAETAPVAAVEEVPPEAAPVAQSTAEAEVAPVVTPQPEAESPPPSPSVVVEDAEPPVAPPLVPPVVKSEPRKPAARPEPATVLPLAKPESRKPSAPLVVKAEPELRKPAARLPVAKPEPRKSAVPSLAKPEPRKPTPPPVAKAELELRKPAVLLPVAKPEPRKPAAPPLVKPELQKPAAPPLAKPEPKKPAAPPMVKAPSPPASSQPAAAPAKSVARAEPRLQVPPALPPIRLESRSQPPAALPPIRLESRSQPPAALPPINLVSRTAASSAPAGAKPSTKTPKPISGVAAPSSASATRSADPMTQFQDDAARASVAIRRDVEALTGWLGRTGASINTEIQRGLRDADQAVSRWTGSGGAQVERRDRWSERRATQSRRAPAPQVEEFTAPRRPQQYR